MSAIAGRVLILPKGEYDASVAYEFLDLINYGGRSWIAKKASIGIEPTDTNEEYWQPFGSSFIPDGVTVEINENGEISVVDSPKLGGKDASEYALDADLANYLPLSGGTVITNSYNALRIKRTGTGYAGIMFENDNGALLGIGASENDSLEVISQSGGRKGILLHTGNKPTGTYTGNGDATSRTIDIGGIGGMLAIYSSVKKRMAFVTSGGAVCIDENGVITPIKNTTITDNNTSVKLLLNSDNIALNENGTTYGYSLL